MPRRYLVVLFALASGACTQDDLESQLRTSAELFRSADDKWEGVNLNLVSRATQDSTLFNKIIRHSSDEQCIAEALFILNQTKSDLHVDTFLDLTNHQNSRVRFSAAQGMRDTYLRTNSKDVKRKIEQVASNLLTEKVNNLEFFPTAFFAEICWKANTEPCDTALLVLVKRGTSTVLEKKVLDHFSGPGKEVYRAEVRASLIKKLRSWAD